MGNVFGGDSDQEQQEGSLADKDFSGVTIDDADSGAESWSPKSAGTAQAIETHLEKLHQLVSQIQNSTHTRGGPVTDPCRLVRLANQQLEALLSSSSFDRSFASTYMVPLPVSSPALPLQTSSSSTPTQPSSESPASLGQHPTSLIYSCRHCHRAELLEGDKLTDSFKRYQHHKQHTGEWTLNKVSTEFNGFPAELKQNLRSQKAKRLEQVHEELDFVLEDDSLEASKGSWSCCQATHYYDPHS